MKSPIGARPPPTLAAIEEQRDAAARELIRKALRYHSGNVTAAAVDLGLNRRTLDRQINALGLRAWLSGAYPRSARQPTRARSIRGA